MDLAEALKQTRLDEARSAIEPGWDASARILPRGALSFLQPAFIREACSYSQVPDEVVEQAVRAAKRIADDPALRALIWHWRRRAYGGGPSARDWPLPTDALGDDAGMFYLLGTISNYPAARRAHEEHNIPADIVAATMGNIRFQLSRHRKRHGAWGVEPLYAGGWLTNHFRGIIYTLGRLQYIARPFPSDLSAFRNRDSGRVLALAADGVEFRDDGQRNGAAGLGETKGIWRSALRNGQQ